jgi:6-phospho-3-hexuloisomerase
MNEDDSTIQETVSPPSSEKPSNKRCEHTPCDPSDLAGIATHYKDYINEVIVALSRKEKEIDELCSLIRTAGAIHIFGFGRSGTAALACAIRLRQFCEYIPEVWWVGDQVRMPIRENDLVILISKDGSRSELAAVAYRAAQKGAKIVLVTTNRNSRVSALARLKIFLPLSNLPFIYGNGDFEIAAFYFQEMLVTYLGKKMCIPKECVWRNHV